ncbi:hypothetical protein [Streptosporangium sp. NPDC001681]|uniref:hypothetical protein n=1 Tax=Streptosporangium sp. NPDC001681 TaxID=3154395 RepID=UPI0033343343
MRQIGSGPARQRGQTAAVSRRHGQGRVLVLPVQLRMMNWPPWPISAMAIMARARRPVASRRFSKTYSPS